MNKKIISVLITLILLSAIGCTKQMTRADFQALPDKTFHITDVVVGHSSQKGLLVKGVGVKEESLKKEALLALPVIKIAKVISDELKIQVDTSEYENADIKSINSKFSTFTDYEYLSGILLWQTKKKISNKINIKFLLLEKQATIGFAVHFRMGFEIDIITSAGAKNTITVWMPQQGHFDPEKITKEQNKPVEEVTKSIMLEEISKLPELLKAELTKIK